MHLPAKRLILLKIRNPEISQISKKIIKTAFAVILLKFLLKWLHWLYQMRNICCQLLLFNSNIIQFFALKCLVSKPMLTVKIFQANKVQARNNILRIIIWNYYIILTILWFTYDIKYICVIYIYIYIYYIYVYIFVYMILHDIILINKNQFKIFHTNIDL